MISLFCVFVVFGCENVDRLCVSFVVYVVLVVMILVVV